MQRLALITVLSLAALPARAELTVVLDPGHGGSNLGARGVIAGLYEKKLVLVLSRLLRRRLERDGVRVVATRERDTYLTLGARVRHANASPGDVFLSLHANATEEHAHRGFSAWVLSRQVTDVQARKVAEAASGPAEAAVARATVRDTARRSASLAATIRKHLERVREPDLGTRQAPFDVLEGLRMPAALIEVGFIDHVEEGVELVDPENLRAIADAIADALEEFASPPATAPAP